VSLPRDHFATKNWALFLIAGFIACYLLTLSVRPMTRLDEFRYAEIAREMLATGDWISPRLNGVRYFEKPVLGHWIGAAMQWAFGESTFATRFPSAFSTGLTALFLFLFLRRCGQGPRTGLVAAFVYLTCLAVFGIGTTDILDPLLNLWLTLAIGFFYWAYIETDSNRRTIKLLLVGLCCGLAFLTKGFLAFAVPAVVALAFIVWRLEWSRLLSFVWLPAVAAVLVALPWAIMIHRQESDFWHYFFWVEHIQRFLSERAQHSEPPWYFLVRFPGVVFPWIVMVPLAIAGLCKRLSDSTLTGYLLAWFVMPFAFFSLSSGKLITYILPCLPAFAMLVAIGLKPFMGRDNGNTGTPARTGLAVLLLAYSAALAYLLMNRLGWVGRPVFDASETYRWAAAAGGLAGSATITAAGLRAKRVAWRLMTPGYSILVLMLVVYFVIPNSTRGSKMPGEFFNSQKSQLGSDTILISDGSYFRAVAWVFERDDIYMADEGELAYGLSYPESRHRLLDEGGARSLIAENFGVVDMAFFINENTERWLAPLMPATAKRSEFGNYIVWRIPAEKEADNDRQRAAQESG